MKTEGVFGWQSSGGVGLCGGWRDKRFMMTITAWLLKGNRRRLFSLCESRHDDMTGSGIRYPMTYMGKD
jgi:hypothetical protein